MVKKPKKPLKPRLAVQMDQDKLIRFGVACSSRGVTMSDIVHKYIDSVIEKWWDETTERIYQARMYQAKAKIKNQRKDLECI